MAISRYLWARDQRVGGPVDKLMLILIADAGGGGDIDRSHLAVIARYAEISEADALDACLRLTARGVLNMSGGRIGLNDGQET